MSKVGSVTPADPGFIILAFHRAQMQRKARVAVSHDDQECLDAAEAKRIRKREAARLQKLGMYAGMERRTRAAWSSVP